MAELTTRSVCLIIWFFSLCCQEQWSLIKSNMEIVKCLCSCVCVCGSLAMLLGRHCGCWLNLNHAIGTGKLSMSANKCSIGRNTKTTFMPDCNFASFMRKYNKCVGDRIAYAKRAWISHTKEANYFIHRRDRRAVIRKKKSYTETDCAVAKRHGGTASISYLSILPIQAVIGECC